MTLEQFLALHKFVAVNATTREPYKYQATWCAVGARLIHDGHHAIAEDVPSALYRLDSYLKRNSLAGYAQK